MTRKQSTYARNRQRRPVQRSDGITMTRMHNTRLTAPEIQRVLGPCRFALDAMRRAQANYHQFTCLCTAAHVAQAIDDGNIFTGQAAIIADAHQALEAIGQRSGNSARHWHASACHGHELTAIADLVAAHSRQLHELTYGEYTRAATLAADRVASEGGQVFRMETT